MRMWMIDPHMMCKQHLLGEHSELHKHLPTLRRGHSVAGRFSPVVQIQFDGYVDRHDELAIEMKRRGMNHRSPLVDVPDFMEIYPRYMDKHVNVAESMQDLFDRCPQCRGRIMLMSFNNC